MNKNSNNRQVGEATYKITGWDFVELQAYYSLPWYKRIFKKSPMKGKK